MIRTILVAIALINVHGPVLAADEERAVEARDMAMRHIIVDTHIDVPYRLQEDWVDVTRAVEGGDFDYPRARSGGLNTPFMSVFTPAKLEREGGSFQLANHLIDSVEAMVARVPGKFAIVTTPEEARRAMRTGRMGLALGMENGSPIEGNLENVRFFKDRGISYITLAHSLANHISDSSYDEERPNGGLSEFGQQVVTEMNRVGIMVDISHVSDQAFWQALEISKAPLVASHSSARHFTPDFERNMSDEMIVALAENGGVIMINFGSSFLTRGAREYSDAFNELRKAWLEENGYEEDGPEAKQFEEDYRAENPYPYATLEETVAHFDHVIEITGVEHVGIGSDFDGVGDSLPIGLKDVSAYPNLVEAFLKRGYSEEDVARILGGNLMRVWSAVIAYAGEG